MICDARVGDGKTVLDTACLARGASVISQHFCCMNDYSVQNIQIIHFSLSE